MKLSFELQTSIIKMQLMLAGNLECEIFINGLKNVINIFGHVSINMRMTRLYAADKAMFF